MGEKPEVLDAVLKETVDLVMDLTKKIKFLNLYFVGFNGFVSFFCWCCNCRRIYPLKKFLKI